MSSMKFDPKEIRRLYDADLHDEVRERLSAVKFKKSYSSADKNSALSWLYFFQMFDVMETLLAPEIPMKKISEVSKERFIQECFLALYLSTLGAKKSAKRILKNCFNEFLNRKSTFTIQERTIVQYNLSFLANDLNEKLIAKEIKQELYQATVEENDVFAILKCELTFIQTCLMLSHLDEAQFYLEKSKKRIDLNTPPFLKYYCHLLEIQLRLKTNTFDKKADFDRLNEIQIFIETKLGHLEEVYNNTMIEVCKHFNDLREAEYLLNAFKTSKAAKSFDDMLEIANRIHNKYPEVHTADTRFAYYFGSIKSNSNQSITSLNALIIRDNKIKETEYKSIVQSSDSFLDIYGGYFKNNDNCYFLSELQQKCLIAIAACGDEGASKEFLVDCIYEIDFWDPSNGIQRVQKLIDYLIDIGLKIELLPNGYILNTSQLGSIIVPSDLKVKGHFYYVQKMHPVTFSRTQVEKTLMLKKAMAAIHIKNWLDTGIIKRVEGKALYTYPDLVIL